MKPSSSLLAAGLFLSGLTAQSAPFLAIGDSAELFLTGSVGVRFDDNVLLAANKIDDTVFEVVPGLLLEFGKGSQVTGFASYTETISRYSDNGELDDELSALRFQSNYDNGRTKLNLNASFEQLNQNTVDTAVANRGALSPRDVTRLGGNVEFGLSAKGKLGVGLNYVETDYKSAGFTDSEVTTLPLDYFFEFTPKVDGRVGFQYRETTLAGAALNSKDYFYYVGARGEFTPKLTGNLRVGLTERERRGGSSESTLGIDTAMTYLYSAKTQFTASLSNDYGNSGTGDSQRNMDIAFGVRSDVSSTLSLNARFSFRNIDYFNRPADDYTEITVGGDYRVNQFLSLHSSLAVRNNESGSPQGDFDNTVFSLAARLRY